MELINKLAEQGVAYLLLAISFSANYFLYKECRGVQEKRVEEAKQARDLLIEPIKAIQQTVNFILAALEKPRRG